MKKLNLVSFPKIFALGTDYVSDIFRESVEITEKIDGSQFVFAKVDDEIYLRSKGKQMYKESYEKMFKFAVEYVVNNKDFIPENYIFYCEFLNKPKHNTLKYDRVPKNNLILFGVADLTATRFISNYKELKEFADKINIEVAPLLFSGKINSVDEVKEIIEQESILGGCKMEGVVVKNYERKFLLGGQPMPLMAGKYVSEKFKEVHNSRWGKEEKTKSRFEDFKQSFRTDARWEKAVQHLKENGELSNSPKDIGLLMKEVNSDIEKEEEENIKKWLYNEYKAEILRYATRGLPEWYKEKLLDKSNI